MADKASSGRHRPNRIGKVVSRSGNKTIVVEITRRVQHPFYKRYVNRTKNFYAHDERNQCQVGDWVRIVETRPLSRLKRWRLQEILRQGSGEALPKSEESPT
ncbi:MAG: 30S ribosomal protein S17 [Acidobacteria bacterium]|nr:30S ribosomal protein S17 [Acidobacteriota bacterium]